MTTVISVEHLSKAYRLGQIGTGTFTNDLKLWWARMRGQPNPLARIGDADHGNRDGEEVWALKDVSFQVQQGEVLGIIGRNGAGKSTLLKILSRVTAPTSGEIKVKGRVASLLEVGTGFHPELTGRENIYLNGAILGMTRQEVTRKLDEIVDFSGVEKFIDTPVKRYSSGMYVRLGFAVAAHLDPDILVVDEVLAVGDFEFQRKCIGKMGDVAKTGRTVLFVSHNMASILQLCTHGILLNAGVIEIRGAITDVVERYIQLSSSNGEKEKALAIRTDRKGTGQAKFINVNITSMGIESRQVKMGNSVAFNLTVDSLDIMKKVQLTLSIYNKSRVLIISTNTKLVSQDDFDLKEGNNSFRCVFNSLLLQVGQYYINLSLAGQNGICDWIEEAASFEVIENNLYETGRSASGSKAIVFLPNRWLLNEQVDNIEKE